MPNCRSARSQQVERARHIAEPASPRRAARTTASACVAACHSIVQPSAAVSAKEAGPVPLEGADDVGERDLLELVHVDGDAKSSPTSSSERVHKAAAPSGSRA